jgi:hypothetical protein
LCKGIIPNKRLHPLRAFGRTTDARLNVPSTAVYLPTVLTMPKWTSFARTRSTTADEKTHQDSISTDDPETAARKPPKWSLGILQDTETDEVPGEFHVPDLPK